MIKVVILLSVNGLNVELRKKKAGSGCKDEEMRSKVYTTCEIPLCSKVEVWKYLHGNGN